MTISKLNDIDLSQIISARIDKKKGVGKRRQPRQAIDLRARRCLYAIYFF
jgi:hypothetical protein